MNENENKEISIGEYEENEENDDLVDEDLDVEFNQDDEPLDDKLISIRSKFFNKFLDPEFINSAYEYCFPYQGPSKIKGPSIIDSDPIFSMIDFWKKDDEPQPNSYYIGGVKGEGEKELIQNINANVKNSNSIEISLNPPEIITKNKNSNNQTSNLKNETPFIYSDVIEKIISNKFKDFGAFKDFENLIKMGISFYEDYDEISRFDLLLNQKQNDKSKEIILSKMNSRSAELYKIEIQMISEIEEEFEKRVKSYKLIHKDDLTKTEISMMLSDESIIKIFMRKEYNISDISKIIKIFYEIKSYPKWICSILKPLKIHKFNKNSTKKINYMIYDNDLFQKRDINIYSFINNKLSENKSLQFICRSLRENEVAFNEIDIPGEQSETIRMDLKHCQFEIKIIDKEKFILTGFINIDTQLKMLHVDYLETLCRQYMKDFFKKINELLKLSNEEFKKMIPRSRGKEFYQFVTSEYWKNLKIKLNF